MMFKKLFLAQGPPGPVYAEFIYTKFESTNCAVPIPTNMRWYTNIYHFILTKFIYLIVKSLVISEKNSKIKTLILNINIYNIK